MRREKRGEIILILIYYWERACRHTYTYMHARTQAENGFLLLTSTPKEATCAQSQPVAPVSSWHAAENVHAVTNAQVLRRSPLDKSVASSSSTDWKSRSNARKKKRAQQSQLFVFFSSEMYMVVIIFHNALITCVVFLLDFFCLCFFVCFFYRLAAWLQRSRYGHATGFAKNDQATHKRGGISMENQQLALGTVKMVCDVAQQNTSSLVLACKNVRDAFLHAPAKLLPGLICRLVFRGTLRYWVLLDKMLPDRIALRNCIPTSAEKTWRSKVLAKVKRGLEKSKW